MDPEKQRGPEPLETPMPDVEWLESMLFANHNQSPSLGWQSAVVECFESLRIRGCEVVSLSSMQGTMPPSLCHFGKIEHIHDTLRAGRGQDSPNECSWWVAKVSQLSS